MSKEKRGEILQINGPLVLAKDVPEAKIGDMVYLGTKRLLGEIVRIDSEKISCQCYEDTSGLRAKEPVQNTGHPLTAELGPGLTSEIFDGLQFSEKRLWEEHGPFMKRGVKIEKLDRDRKWDFVPKVEQGKEVIEGDILGTVKETAVIDHKILVPTGMRGEITEIREGKFTVTEPIARLQNPSGEEKEISMLREWSIKQPRPYRERLPLAEPLITGQRVVDTFFPVAKGGAAAVPGGFGTGKTVLLHQIAKWSDADIVIYVGCGERGNEMAEVVNEFPEIEDPRTGKKIIERSILIANVSNLPVYAREASIHMGATLGEYFRDQGFKVALMADSTSRWAEALRDRSGRLEEIPAERGYPAYLAEEISSFYERAGRVSTLGRNGSSRRGSLTILGAVSPPGGDFTEPVTSITMRFIGTLWALDKDLAFSRHFPAISYLRSFSSYFEELREYWSNISEGFSEYRSEALSLLEEASEVEQIARIIGERSLPEDQRLILLISDILKEGFLIQNAFHEIDTFCPPKKQAELLKTIIRFYQMTEKLVEEGVPISKIRKLDSVEKLKRVKEEEGVESVHEIGEMIEREISKLSREYTVRMSGEIL